MRSLSPGRMDQKSTIRIPQPKGSWLRRGQILMTSMRPERGPQTGRLRINWHKPKLRFDNSGPTIFNETRRQTPGFPNMSTPVITLLLLNSTLRILCRVAKHFRAPFREGGEMHAAFLKPPSMEQRWTNHPKIYRRRVESRAQESSRAIEEPGLSRRGIGKNPKRASRY